MLHLRTLLVRTVVAASLLIPSAASAQYLPSSWSTADIGSPALTGAASAANGVFTVTGAGADIWDSSDQFRFVYQRVTGDTQIIARVASLQAAHAWSKAGVMIRGALTGPSAHAMLIASSEKGWAFQRRQYDGGFSLNTQQAGVAPGWVRLVREGSLITAHHSSDGSNWTLVGTETVQIGAAAYVGLAVTSHNASATATAAFTNVAIRAPTAANIPPAVSIIAPLAGGSFTAPATVQISAAASDSDGVVNGVQFFANNVLIGTATAAPFAVSWPNVSSGSYNITAVATDNGGGSTTSASVLVSVKTPDASSPDFGAGTGGGVPAPWATADVGGPARAGWATASNGVFTVAGSGFDIWDSSDQFRFVYQRVTGDAEVVARVASLQAVHAWSKAGVMIRGALTGSSPHVVLFAAGDKGWAFQRRPDDAGLSVSTSTQAGVAPGWVRLVRRGHVMSAYQSDDGSNWTLVGTETVQMAATVYVGLAVTSHNVSATAVATFSNVAVSTPAPTNQAPAISIVGPASGTTFFAPAATSVTATASDPDGTVSNVRFFANSALIGTSSAAPFSISWRDVPQGSYSLTAVATDNAGASTTSAAVSITVRLGAAATLPTRIAFTPSTDHATVTSYAVHLHRATDPVTAPPVTTRDLGKPAPVSGEIVVDISTLVDPLAAGSYYAVVIAVGPGGVGASDPSAGFAK